MTLESNDNDPLDDIESDVFQQTLFAWRLASKYYAEMGGEPPTSEEWTQLGRILSTISCLIEDEYDGWLRNQTPVAKS
jgi:hypothetical protein